MTSQFPDFRLRFARQMADYSQRVAGNVTRVREAAGYDREPFAYKAGISPKQLERIEKGQSFPRRATVRKLAGAAGVPITDIQPDLDADESDLRDQLNRLEARVEATQEMVHTLLARVPAPTQTEDDDAYEVPDNFEPGRASEQDAEDEDEPGTGEGAS